MVLNIFSYWAEHKGRIPINKVCRRPWARESPSSPKCTHNYRTTASVPSPQAQHSYWQYLLAVQVVTVEEEGVDRISRASGLHRRGRHVQEVLGGQPRGQQNAWGQVCRCVGTDTKYRYRLQQRAGW